MSDPWGHVGWFLTLSSVAVSTWEGAKYPASLSAVGGGIKPRKEPSLQETGGKAHCPLNLFTKVKSTAPTFAEPRLFK